MGRKILAVIVALIAATAIIMIVEMLNSYVLPPPNADIMKDPAKLKEYMANGPTLAYIVVIVGYFLGSLAGGFIVRNMSRRESPGMGIAILIGGVLTVLGIVNMVMLPGQPLWFMILALITFVPSALLGAKFAGR